MREHCVTVNLIYWCTRVCMLQNRPINFVKILLYGKILGINFQDFSPNFSRGNGTKEVRGLKLVAQFWLEQMLKFSASTKYGRIRASLQHEESSLLTSPTSQYIAARVDPLAAEQEPTSGYFNMSN